LGEATDIELDSASDSNVSTVPEEFIGIELSNICFNYPGDLTQVLKNINFKVEPKARLVIFGKNSSGKSTLLKIIAGWIEPTSGLFFINDHYFSKIKPSDYRSKIGMIASNQSTFEGTILENITLNNADVSDEKLKYIIKNIHLEKFIKSQPDGLDMQIKSEGKGLPSSVVQKIVLARTIIHQPKLLIMEEPLDKMDTKQAHEIIDFLTDPQHDWTLIVASQNPYWLEKSSHSIGLKNGIVESDTKK